MSTNITKEFTTRYVSSLRERSRVEKRGVKWGIDWLIYSLGQTLYGKPLRLPFMRQSDGSVPKSKTEAEFGVDVSFISDDGRKLSVFVLKDEQLTNSTWVHNGFDEDLRKAICPDLSGAGLETIVEVEVILVYNQDEEANGLTLFQNFAANAPRHLASRATLKISRWNLSDLVDMVLKHLLSPALLPQQFFGQINYLCSQVADFRHGSDEWEQQLIPGWRRFIDDVVAQDAGARGIALVSMSLIILRQHGEKNASIETGWIDLIEWAAIVLWRSWSKTEDKNTRNELLSFWYGFYGNALEQLYRAHHDAMATEGSIDQKVGGDMPGLVATAAIAYWHVGRIGLLSQIFSEILPSDTEETQARRTISLRETANWMVGLINANQAALRPLLDINHVEIVLLSLTLSHAGRISELGEIFLPLARELFFRRIGRSNVPFLNGSNSLSEVFSQVVSKESADKAQSSFFVLMLLELCYLLDAPVRDTLVVKIHRWLVLGAADDGLIDGHKALHLTSWIPPKEWESKVFYGFVDDGEEVTRGPLSDNPMAEASELIDEMKSFVTQMRQVAPHTINYALNTPLSAIMLACIRHRSPVPPEIWRQSAFPAPVPDEH